MQYKDRILDDNELVASESSFLKKVNNYYISEEQVRILENYGINPRNYKNVNELIMEIEEYLNNSIDYMEDLEWVSSSLSEYNYYNNTNK